MSNSTEKAPRTAWDYWLGKEKEYRALLGEDGCRHIASITKNAPGEAQALTLLAEFLSHVGLPDEAIEAYETLLARRAEPLDIHMYLQTLLFTSPEKYSHQYVYDAYTRWGKKLVSGESYTVYPGAASRNRRLRIGYTCHFITNSTSSTLLVPLLKSHHRDRVEVFMYSDQQEGITDEVRQSCEHWRDTGTLSDQAFCELVHRDQIDILLELNGHTVRNRYAALTRKPAPVQVNYYNHSATCGVPGVDYILLGEEVGIDSLQPYYSEKIFHKKGVQLATVVGGHFPAPAPPPCIENGYITFGSFGQAHKVSRQQIGLWCEVLKRVPDSEFYMKAAALGDPVKRLVFAKHFTDCGIEPGRLRLEGQSDYGTLLASYSQMDIALDTYPFGAGTTTVEALIQGVPVIALVGERLSAKHGYINLHTVGHDELLAYSPTDYIDKAVALAANPQQLAHYRETLRHDFIHSKRADMERFITDLEDAYTVMWDDYLKQHIS